MDSYSLFAREICRTVIRSNHRTSTSINKRATLLLVYKNRSTSPLPCTVVGINIIRKAACVCSSQRVDCSTVDRSFNTVRGTSINKRASSLVRKENQYTSPRIKTDSVCSSLGAAFIRGKSKQLQDYVNNQSVYSCCSGSNINTTAATKVSV